jgi:hypothetical protein
MLPGILIPSFHPGVTPPGREGGSSVGQFPTHVLKVVISPPQKMLPLQVEEVGIGIPSQKIPHVAEVGLGPPQKMPPLQVEEVGIGPPSQKIPPLHVVKVGIGPPSQKMPHVL